MGVVLHTHRIHIKSDFVVSVEGDHCSIPATVDAEIVCDPTYVLITDSRPSFFVWSQANRVKVTASIF